MKKIYIFLAVIAIALMFSGCGLFTEYKYGYIDKTGHFVIEPQFNNALPFSEDMAAVMIGNVQFERWGYIDMTGSLVINYQYDRVRGFAEGLSPVMEDNKWIFIDKQGNKAIDEEYLDA